VRIEAKAGSPDLVGRRFSMPKRVFGPTRTWEKSMHATWSSGKAVGRAAIVGAVLAAGAALASEPSPVTQAQPVVLAQTTVTQSTVTTDVYAPNYPYPAHEARVRAAARAGPEALRRYIQRTRMIWNFYYPDFALR
jgi:hypothetical protein